MELEKLDLDIKTYNAVRRAGFTTVEELMQGIADDPERVRLTVGYSHFDSVETALAELDEPRQTVIVSVTYARAVALTKHIIAHAQAMQQSLYEVCKGLKEMRDGKLYRMQSLK